MLYEKCISESLMGRNFSRSPHQNPNEDSTAPENAKQFDSLPELPSFGGYENFVTAMNMFPAIYLPTRHLTKTPKQLLKLESTL